MKSRIILLKIFSNNIFLPAIFLLLSITSIAQDAKKAEVISYNPNAVKDSSKRSIKSMATGKIGKANVIISYHSPAVRKRVIWGGLVPYDDVWVTGAHSATSIIINKPFMVGDKKIIPGKYALFSIPAVNEWTIILNRNWQQHLADDYNIKDDVVRVRVKPIVKDSNTERLQYFITNRANNEGTIAVEWEKLRIEIPVKIL